MSKLNNSNRMSAYKFLVPFLIAFLMVNLFPYLTSFFVSFNYWNLYTPFNAENIKAVGLENYGLIFTEKGLYESLLEVLLFVSITVTMVHCSSLIFAKLISMSAKKAQAFILIAFITPFVINSNALNLGLIEMGIDTFYDFRDSTVLERSVSESKIVTYQFIGFFTLIYYMVLKSVPKNIIEAAQLEGASIIKIFFAIELPHLKRMIVMMLILSIIMMMQSAQGFVDIIGVLFRDGDMGMASAFSWIFILFICLFMLITILTMKFKKNKKELVK